jgi:glutamine amidotransferase
MEIAVIDYNAGNVASLRNSLKRLGLPCALTSGPEQIESADRVILPGVGRAGTAMRELRARGLDRVIPRIVAPFLGICLGLQLIASSSEEDETECLSIIPGRVKRFPSFLRTPEIGWNRVYGSKGSLLLQDIPDGSYFYFVHSYYFDTSPDYTIGTTPYGFDYPSIVQRDNFYAVQFHPEKSGEVGLELLRNFCRRC